MCWAHMGLKTQHHATASRLKSIRSASLHEAPPEVTKTIGHELPTIIRRIKSHKDLPTIKTSHEFQSSESKPQQVMIAVVMLRSCFIESGQLQILWSCCGWTLALNLLLVLLLALEAPLVSPARPVTEFGPLVPTTTPFTWQFLICSLDMKYLKACSFPFLSRRAH